MEKLIMNVQHNMVKVTEGRQIIWFGHLKRIKSKKIPKVILQWNAKGRRRKGKPSGGM